ncbi:MAG: RNA-binding S4 domain-containing protein [Bacteroidia bacterium]|nr:RNA-binding S4 domain-containing protein [Bacteroidia bacterium]
MEQEVEVRIDKWLWAVRIFKTRNMATQECRKGRILINGVQVKPSRIIKQGDIIAVKQDPLTRTYKVKALLSKRVSAKVAVEFTEDITPPEELQKLELCKAQHEQFFRPHGTGRPTKKERRTLNKYLC